jgi:hypothetical protein
LVARDVEPDTVMASVNVLDGVWLPESDGVIEDDAGVLVISTVGATEVVEVCEATDRVISFVCVPSESEAEWLRLPMVTNDDVGVSPTLDVEGKTLTDALIECAGDGVME